MRSSPALGRRDIVLSPLPRPGEVARVPRAGAERVRVHACLEAARPLIRPSATFSRAGEKEHAIFSRAGEKGHAVFSRAGEKRHRVVTSPEAGRGRSGPAGGSRAGEGSRLP